MGFAMDIQITAVISRVPGQEENSRELSRLSIEGDCGRSHNHRHTTTYEKVCDTAVLSTNTKAVQVVVEHTKPDIWRTEFGPDWASLGLSLHVPRDIQSCSVADAYFSSTTYAACVSGLHPLILLTPASLCRIRPNSCLYSPVISSVNITEVATADIRISFSAQAKVPLWTPRFSLSLESILTWKST